MGVKSKFQKIPGLKRNPPPPPKKKKSHAEFLVLKNFQVQFNGFNSILGMVKTSFVVLYSVELRGQDTRALSRIFRLLQGYPKNSLLKSPLKSNHTKKYLPNFPTKKISNPNKSFDHPRQLKSVVTPPPPPQGIDYELRTVSTNCEISLDNSRLRACTQPQRYSE